MERTKVKIIIPELQTNFLIRMSVSSLSECQLFTGYRSLGLVCNGQIKSAVDKRGNSTFLTVAVGKAFFVYDVYCFFAYCNFSVKSFI